ncbi:MAG TPA: fused MFS/spermidine synthase [Stellaceae bacterium]|nr:fused MFS/spermidine synthase [Stellaceae bacterium]
MLGRDRNGFARIVAGALWLALLLVPASGAQAQDSRRLIDSKESMYNNIYIYQDHDDVSMTFGYNRTIYTESIYNTKDDRDLPVVYTRYMTAALMYSAKADNILEIGFGGGRTSWYLHRFLPKAKVTSVELDPAVEAFARKYFGIKDEDNFHLESGDGRLFLTKSPEKYDIVLIDAYRGPFVPFHLLTKEFYEEVARHLAPGGVVAQNVEPSTMLFDSAVKTIQSVLPNIDLYHAEGNVVTIAYPGSEKTAEALGDAAAKRQAEFSLRYDLRDMLPDRLPLGANPDAIDPGGKVLTDDFAPVEALKAIEVHNRKWENKP